MTVSARTLRQAAAGRPVIRLVGTAFAVTDFNTTLSITQPTGVQAGDVGFLQRSHGSPSGWTSIASAVGALTNRVYDGTEGTITITSGSNTQMFLNLAVFRNVHNSSPIDAQSTVRTVTSGTSFTSFSATAVHDGTLHLAVCREFVSSGTPVLTQPTGMNLTRRANPQAVTVGMAHVAGPAAGAAIGTTNWTGSIATYDAATINLLLRAVGT